MVCLRAFRDGDKPRVDELCAAVSMDTPEDYEHITVATSDDSDTVVGFIHLQITGDVAYVNPIIVDASARAQGIGRLLLEDAMAHFDDIRLVARGESAGFYTRLGFKATSWDDVTMAITEDCSVCAKHEECGPVPMRWAAIRD